MDMNQYINKGENIKKVKPSVKRASPILETVLIKTVLIKTVALYPVSLKTV